MANRRRNTGRLSAARARLVAAETAYAALRREHGSSMVSWAEFKRAVAGMSPAAILAETQAALSNPKRRNGADRGAGVRAFSSRGQNVARADADTQTSANKTRKVSARNVKMAVGGGRYDIVRVHRMATRNAAGTWQPAGETLHETEALAWLHGADRNPRARQNPAHTIGDRVTLADGRRGTVIAFRNGGMADVDVGRGIVVRQPSHSLLHTQG